MIPVELQYPGLKITTDEWNYILQVEKVKAKGKDIGAVYWETVGYYNNLTALSRAVVEALAPKEPVSVLKDIKALDSVLEKHVKTLAGLLKKGAK